MIMGLKGKLLLFFMITFGLSFLNCQSSLDSTAEIPQIQKPEETDNLMKYFDVEYYSQNDKDSNFHKLNLFIPKQVDNPPLMIWIHGGAWAFGGREHETELAEKFAAEGIAVAAISYRLSPATWRDPKYNKGVEHPEHIRDVARAFAYLHSNAEEFGYNKHSIFLSGYSSGGHLSALLCLDPTYLEEVGKSVRDIKGAIPIAGAYDIESYYDSHLRFNGKTMADAHVKGVFGQTDNQLKNASVTNYLDNQWVPMLVISERETFEYTKILEDEAKDKDYDRMNFIHNNNLNHKSLYDELAHSENSSNRKRIVDFIKAEQMDYSFLKRDGFELAYKLIGTGEPLFLLNGGPGFSSHNFVSLAKRLPSQYMVILFDQRGTGYSKLKELNSSTIGLDLMVEDMELLRKHLQLDEINIMGQSFGGMYAMAYADKYPDKVKRLILSHSGGMDMSFLGEVNITPTNNNTESEEEAKDFLSSGYFQNPDIRSMQRSKSIAPSYVFNKSKADQVFKGLAFNSRYYPEINSLVWRDMRSINYDLKTSMNSFSKPVLILHGDHDVVNPKYARENHKIFPNSTLVILKDCVHYGWIDTPKDYFDSLENFLGNNID